MRKAVLHPLGKAILGEREPHDEKVLILTGAGRDGKDELMGLMHTLFPHLVSLSDGHFTTSATTRIA
eukprot:3241393-Pleurochrysis_carterae.AAC.1